MNLWNEEAAEQWMQVFREQAQALASKGESLVERMYDPVPPRFQAGQTVRIGLFFYEVLRYSQARRHVHFRRLAARKRRKGVHRPPREWMRRALFETEAEPVPTFQRGADGVLVYAMRAPDVR